MQKQWSVINEITGRNISNSCLINGHIPESWKISTIIPKKGDLTDPNNHRGIGIAITSQVAKTLNRMILNRLRPEVQKLLRDNQNGFSKIYFFYVKLSDLSFVYI